MPRFRPPGLCVRLPFRFLSFPFVSPFSFSFFVCRGFGFVFAFRCFLSVPFVFVSFGFGPASFVRLPFLVPSSFAVSPLRLVRFCVLLSVVSLLVGWVVLRGDQQFVVLTIPATSLDFIRIYANFTQWIKPLDLYVISLAYSIHRNSLQRSCTYNSYPQPRHAEVQP